MLLLNNPHKYLVRFCPGSLPSMLHTSNSVSHTIRVSLAILIKLNRFQLEKIYKFTRKKYNLFEEGIVKLLINYACIRATGAF